MLLDLLFPKYCLLCKTRGKYVCNACLANVPKARPICPVCKMGSYGGKTHESCKTNLCLDGLTSFFEYQGVIRKAILGLKYKFAYDIALELSGLVDFNHKNSILVPVPLHIARERWRGFNQAGIVANLVAKRAGAQYFSDGVLRLENTTPQVKLGKTDRMQNIRGKFAVKRGFVPNPDKTYVIFDDVWTTGATISEVCMVLKKAGAKEVWGMSLART